MTAIEKINQEVQDFKDKYNCPDYNKQRLIELLDGVETVYTIMRHVSASGMTRWISLHFVKDNEVYHISYSASFVLGMKSIRKYNDALKISGCGMDMGWELVYRLSVALYNDPKRLKQRWL